MPVTNTIRHITVETGNAELTNQSDVAGPTIEFITRVLEEALTGGQHIPIVMGGAKTSPIWMRAREAGPLLRVSIGHLGADDEPLCEMTVRPPEQDDEPAVIQVSITGFLDAVRAGDEDVLMHTKDFAGIAGDLERCIAWAWLELRGYAEAQYIDPQLARFLEAMLEMGSDGMIYTIAENEGEQPELTFVIAVTDEDLVQLPRDPVIQVQASLLFQDGVLLISVMVNIGHLCCETWINILEDDGQGTQALDLLASQDRLTFHLFDAEAADSVRRTLAIPNSLDADDIRASVDNTLNWTMDEFDAAKAKWYARYPTPQALFAYLAETA